MSHGSYPVCQLYAVMKGVILDNAQTSDFTIVVSYCHAQCTFKVKTVYSISPVT